MLRSKDTEDHKDAEQCELPTFVEKATRGFTLIEVMMSLAVFVVGLSGIIAMQTKSLEARAAAKYVQEGERLAQRLMAQARGSGFADLVGRDHAGNPGSLPHLNDDLGLFGYGDRPWDHLDDANEPVVKQGFYRAIREVHQVMIDGSVPAGNSSVLVDAVRIDVYVLWIDDSNTAYPPPENLEVANLQPTHIQAGHDDYIPAVQGVHLRTVRLNDT